MPARLHSLLALLQSYPLYYGIIALSVVTSVSLCAFFLKSRAYDKFYIVISAQLVLFAALSFGHDSIHHMFRAAEIYSMLRDGSVAAFVHFDKFVLPVFYFYSPAIYVFSAPFLALTGDALAAANLASAGFCALTAVGTLALAKQICREYDLPSSDAVLASTLFISSNYVFQNFITRLALAEAAATAFVPLVLLCLLQRRSLLAVILLALQIGTHPPVNMQLLPLLIAAALVLDRDAWRFRGGYVAILAAALALSAVFWLPGLLDKDLILGISKIEGLHLQHANIEESFLGLFDLLRPFAFNNLGLILPAAILAAVFLRGRALEWRAVAAVALWALSVLIQTRALQQVTLQLPMLEISQFIWRWMSFSAFMGFIALILVNRGALSRLAPLVLAAAFASVVMVGAKRSLPDAEQIFEKSAGYLADYKARDALAWGVTEYLPAYALRGRSCAVPGRRDVSMPAPRERELRIAPYESVLIEWAPLVSTGYVYDRERLSAQECEDGILFSAGELGGVLTIEHDPGEFLMAAKIMLTVILTAAAALQGILSLGRTFTRRGSGPPGASR